MKIEQIQQISRGFRLDYLAELRSEDSSSEHGHYVMSAEFKATPRAITAEILVTGLVSEPSHESPLQHHLLPLVSLTIPLIPRTESTGRFSDLAESLADLEIRAIKELGRLQFPLAVLADTSRKAGGLKAVRINLGESAEDKKGPSQNDLRGLRQRRRFEIARAHAQAHFVLRELPKHEEQIQISGQARFTFAELRFANLYTLARALGVKEISPKIFSKEGETLTDEITLQMGPNPQNELTVLVARLKRAGVIPE
jgi:hypothetical protein